MKTILYIFGGGDSSVGIPSTDAKIIIEDNYKEHSDDMIKTLKTFFNEYYDNGKLIILTKDEYEHEELELI